MPNRKQTIIALLLCIIMGVGIGANRVWAENGPYPLWRVSLSSALQEGNGASSEPQIAANGRDIVFTSAAESLVAGDTNGVEDVFWNDLTTRVTERVSVATDGSQANSVSGNAAISFDGTLIAFNSAASNLVLSDTNGFMDIFVRDRLTNTTTRLSVAHDGGQPNAASRYPVMGGDGFQVAYESDADNLVPTDTNSVTDIFLSDNGTFLISQGLNGAPTNGSSHAPAVSAYATHIVFESVASNLVVSDTNGQPDIFLLERDTNTMERISVSSNGAQANGPSSEATVSDNGRFVAFTSFANNLVPNDTNGLSDIFLRDRLLNTTIRVAPATQPNGMSMTPAVASSGKAAIVVFASDATNLVPDDRNAQSDVFVYQNNTGVVRRVSETQAGVEGNGRSTDPVVSPDFITILFTSEASNLVANDLNNAGDIFVENPSAPTAVSLATLNSTTSPYLPLGSFAAVIAGLAVGVLWWRHRAHP